MDIPIYVIVELVPDFWHDSAPEKKILSYTTKEETARNICDMLNTKIDKEDKEDYDVGKRYTYETVHPSILEEPSEVMDHEREKQNVSNET